MRSRCKYETAYRNTHLQRVMCVVDLGDGDKMLHDSQVGGVLGPIARGHHHKAEGGIPLIQVFRREKYLQQLLSPLRLKMSPERLANERSSATYIAT